MVVRPTSEATASVADLEVVVCLFPKTFTSRFNPPPQFQVTECFHVAILSLEPGINGVS